MSEFVIDIEMSLKMDELQDLKKLADKLNLSVPDTARHCMNKACKELLLSELFKSVDKKLLDSKDQDLYNKIKAEPCTHRETLGIDTD